MENHTSGCPGRTELKRRGAVLRVKGRVPGWHENLNWDRRGPWGQHPSCREVGGRCLGGGCAPALPLGQRALGWEWCPPKALANARWAGRSPPLLLSPSSPGPRYPHM